MTSQVQPRSYAATKTYTFPRKRPAGGRPMKPNMKIAIARPRNGRSQPKPARFAKVTGRASSRSRAATIAKAPTLIAEYGIRRRHGHEQEPGVRDARVRKHPLHVRLDESGEIPPRKRRAHDDGERDRPELFLGRERGHEQPQREDERRDLRRGSHEPGHGRGCSLVHVRRPHV